MFGVVGVVLRVCGRLGYSLKVVGRDYFLILGRGFEVLWWKGFIGFGYYYGGFEFKNFRVEIFRYDVYWV